MNRQILLALNPCVDGLARATESPTLREWWDTSTSRSDMMWLVGRAHANGTLPQRTLVRVAVRCCETVAHLMPPEALPLLADLAAWCGGADDVDLWQVRDALLPIMRAYAAAVVAAAAMCDVIRDAITIDEVCAALGLDADRGVA